MVPNVALPYKLTWKIDNQVTFCWSQCVHNTQCTMFRPLHICIYVSQAFIATEICEVLSYCTATPTTIGAAVADATNPSFNTIQPITFIESIQVPPTTEHLAADNKSTGSYTFMQCFMCVYSTVFALI